MAKLTDDEKSLFDKLKAKLDAPDRPSVTKSIQGIIDFGDPKQVAAAIKHGFLDPDDDGDGDGKKEGDGKKDGDGSGPKRRGYFQDKDE